MELQDYWRILRRHWLGVLAIVLLLFTLSYCGDWIWTPTDPFDRAVVTAFNADQRRDKGFGPARFAAAHGSA